MNNQAFSKIWIAVIVVVILAGGILAWQYWRVPKEEVKAPEEKAPEEVVEVVKDETADWKTYRNEEYGYELRYPPFSRFYGPLETNGKRITIFTAPTKELLEKQEFFEINIELWTEFGEGRDNFQEWVEREKSLLTRPGVPGEIIQKVQEENITLDKVPATKLSVLSIGGKFGDFLTIVIFIQNKGRMYRISTWVRPEDQDIHLPTFNQILSTFRFLE